MGSSRQFSTPSRVCVISRGRVRYMSSLRTPTTSVFAMRSKSLASAASGVRVCVGRVGSGRALMPCKEVTLTQPLAASFANSPRWLLRAACAASRGVLESSGERRAASAPVAAAATAKYLSRASRELAAVGQSSSTACVPGAATNTELMPYTVWPWKAPSKGCGSVIVIRTVAAASPPSGIEVERSVFTDVAKTSAHWPCASAHATEKAFAG
mmetsp:Transcript_30232/g.70091  ORF Transcript_30232/g.70091 Transcript_30232/m.70091 type:complete len:212 (-) Transcript_30232:69-704(-)